MKKLLTILILLLTVVSAKAVVTPLFDENGKADLSKLEKQAEATTISVSEGKATVTTQAGWTGVQLNVPNDESVSGKEIKITMSDARALKVTVKKSSEDTGTDFNLDAAAVQYIEFDETTSIYQIQIQPTEATTLVIEEIKVNAESTKPVVTPLFDENGKADLSKLEKQADATTISVADGKATVTTQAGWTGVQLTVPSDESVSGKEIKITMSEAKALKVSVKKSSEDTGTDFSLDAAAVQYIEFEETTSIYQIQIQPTEATTLVIEEIKVNAESTKPVVTPLFDENGKADLSKLEKQADATTISVADGKATVTTQAGWTGVQLTVPSDESVSGKEIKITMSEAKALKVSVKKSSEDTGTDFNLDAAAVQYIEFDETTSIYQIQIQPTEATTLVIEEIKVNAESTKPAEPETPDTPEKTGIDISLAELNEGWSSTYDATTKTITTEGEWAARGWYIGDDRYNNKGSITVKFNAVEHDVTLKMEYTNADGEAKDVSAGAAAGETEVTLNIPANVKTIDKVYITYQPAGSLTLTEATVSDKRVDKKFTLTLSTPENGTVVIKKGNEEVKAGEFDENTELTLTATAAEGYEFTKWQKNGEDAGTEATLTVKMTADMTIAAVFSKKTEPIIDEETGETDLTEMAPQDSETTTVTVNTEDNSITIETTEPYKAAQIWFNEPEEVKGNVLIVDIAEANVDVTVTVKYTDGTESSMSSTTSESASRRAAAAGTKISVPLEMGKEVQNIEVKNAKAGKITIQKMVVTTKNVFDADGKGDLSMMKPQSNATYDTATYTLAVTKGWTGATLTPLTTESVSGVELMVTFVTDASVKVAVTYTDGEGTNTIMEKAAKFVKLALDDTKKVKEIQIQPTAAGVVQFQSLSVNKSETPDPDYVAPLEENERRTLWESAEGEELQWNNICEKGANYGTILEEREELEVYISSRVAGNEWPKVFIRDVHSEECGSVLELANVDEFPYMAKFKLTAEMVEQLRDGFSICGDGIVVTQVCLYKPAALKPGDIDVADLNGGYQSSYDAATRTITTTARWAARGWDIGDDRYNGYDVVFVQFEAVDFPVTLRMEYVDVNGVTKTLSQGAPAGSTQVEIEIPDDVQIINYVYLMYQNPGTLTLTNAEVGFATGIHTVKTGAGVQTTDDAWYQLDGKRVSKPGKGLYIHNGKKILVK